MNAAFGPRANGLRLLRIVVVAVAFGTMLNTAAGVALFVLNGNRVSQINAERARNVRQSCLDTNARHDGTIAQLDRLLEPRLVGASEADRQRLLASRTTTIALVDALAPRRDCAALVKQQVGSNP